MVLDIASMSSRLIRMATSKSSMTISIKDFNGPAAVCRETTSGDVIVIWL
jgi:hypothetical protein